MHRFLDEMRYTDFRLVYKSVDHSTDKTARWLLVLDSSFNPPHIGHLSLIENALCFEFGTALDETEPHKVLNVGVGKRVLLLLSIENADKSSQPASFEERLEMMIQFAKYVEVKFNVCVDVALTTKPKFVDKLAVIKGSYVPVVKCDTNPGVVFLVGFDTLIRILNPKYYLPNSLLRALSDFFTSSFLFCLLRSSDLMSLEQQCDYIVNLSRGSILDVPVSWSKRIFLVNDKQKLTASYVSSSRIRQDIKEKNYEWKECVIPDTESYIIAKHLYL